MGLAATILVALGAILCLTKPTWGFLAFVAVIIIRPNEQWDDVLLPTVPLMILAAGLGYLLHANKALPRPEGARVRVIVFWLATLALLGLHLLIWRRWMLLDWILSELAPSFLLLLYLTRFFSTPARLHAYFATVSLSTGVVTAIPLFVHLFLRGPLTFVRDEWRNLVPSFGVIWDQYHLAPGSDRVIGRAKGMWGNSNDLGMLCNWGIACALAWVRRPGSKLLRLLGLALAVMFAAVLMLTGSRGGQLQLGVTLWMLFVGGRRKLLGVVLLVVAVAGILFVLPRLAPERRDTAASSRERQVLLMVGVGMFKSNPVIGTGYASFPEHSFHRLQAHNAYMQCLAETGLIGASLFFPLVLFLRRDTTRGARRLQAQGVGRLTTLASSISALQFSFTIYLLFANHFMRFTFAIPMVMGLALDWAAAREAQRRETAITLEDAPRPKHEGVPPQPHEGVPPPPPGGVVVDVEAPPSPRPPPGPSLDAPEPRYVFDPARPGAGVEETYELEVDPAPVPPALPPARKGD